MDTQGSIPTLLVFLAGAALLAVLVVVVFVFLSQLRNRREPSAQAAYTRGLTALIAGDRRSALSWLKEAVQEDSNNLDAYIRLGDLLREIGEAKKALAVHRDLTVRPNIHPEEHGRILSSMIRDYLALERFEEAGQAADRLRNVEKKNPLALSALRQVAESLEDWPRAIEAHDAFTAGRFSENRAKEEQARYRTFAARKEFAAGNVDAAEAHLKNALRMNPECTDTHRILGDIQESRGKVEAALEHWRQEALIHPSRSYRVFERLERAFFETGRFGEITGLYREVLERTPKEEAVPALLALAEIHRRKGELSEAETFVAEALEIDPQNIRAHRDAIKIALDHHDPQTALVHIDRMLGVSEASAPVFPGE